MTTAIPTKQKLAKAIREHAAATSAPTPEADETRQAALDLQQAEPEGTA